MNNAPQYSLRWNNYVNHVRDAFNNLRLENDLVDVTLCCDGGKIRAHKMLLSVCSDYFRQIFRENPCQHPIVIFKNVKFEDLNALVNFMYHGEVNIFQEQLESFLVTAELLEVKGLTDNTEEDKHPHQGQVEIDDNISLDLSSKASADEISADLTEPINLATVQTEKKEIPPIYKSSSEEETETEAGAQNQIEADGKLELPNTSHNTHSKGEEASTSEVMQIDNQQSSEESPEKNSPDSDMVLKFRCHMCPKGFKHPTSLTLHKDSHTGKTQCPVCHRSFSRSYDMRSHLQRIHQGKQLTIKEIRYRNADSRHYNHNI